jgi:hypothetical protein
MPRRKSRASGLARTAATCSAHLVLAPADVAGVYETNGFRVVSGAHQIATMPKP